MINSGVDLLMMFVSFSLGANAKPLKPEYTIKHEALSVTDYNPDFFDEAKITLFWYNRTTKAFNGSAVLKKDLGENLVVNLTVYKFTNHQFRYYPVDFRKNFCEFLRLNLFGARDVAALAHVSRCPIAKGVYQLNNIIPDVNKFPEYLIPNGRYKIKGSMYTFGIYVGTTTWQGEILAEPRFVF